MYICIHILSIVYTLHAAAGPAEGQHPGRPRAADPGGEIFLTIVVMYSSLSLSLYIYIYIYT